MSSQLENHSFSQRPHILLHVVRFLGEEKKEIVQIKQILALKKHGYSQGL